MLQLLYVYRKRNEDFQLIKDQTELWIELFQRSEFQTLKIPNVIEIKYSN